MNNYKLAPFLVLITFLCALIMWIVLPLDIIFPIIYENGPIEGMTIVFYLVAIICIWLPRVKRYSTPIICITSTIAIQALAAREGDLHKVFGSLSVLKLKFWVSDVSIMNKIIAAAVILPMILSILYLCIKFWKSILQAAKQYIPSAVTLMTFCILIVVTKILDRSLDVVTQILSWDSPRWVTALQNSLEESLEMLLPILLILFIFQKVKEKSTANK